MRASTASLRGEHQHRHVRPGPAQLPAHLEAVESGQHHVEDEGVVVGNRRLVERVAAVSRHVNGVGLFAKPFREHLRGPRLILDQQHSHDVPGSDHPKACRTV